MHYKCSPFCSKQAREVREEIEIRSRGAKTLNRKEGTYLLSQIYDSLIAGEETNSRQRIYFPGKVDHMVILKKSPGVVRRNVNYSE